jgi:hypothetical protein
MAYYKVRIEGWCDADPTESPLGDIVQQMISRNGAICTLQEVVEVVHRPQDIHDEDAMTFFGGDLGDAEESTGLGIFPSSMAGSIEPVSIGD